MTDYNLFLGSEKILEYKFLQLNISMLKANATKIITIAQHDKINLNIQTKYAENR
jgi:hypothetical protein